MTGPWDLWQAEDPRYWADEPAEDCICIPVTAWTCRACIEDAESNDEPPTEEQ